MQKRNQLLNIKGIIFRTKDLHQQGINNYEIQKLLNENVLTKLYNGVYAISDLDKLHITDINVIIENGIISLTSAACIYKLTTGEMGKFTITLNRDSKPPKLPYDIFSYYYTSSKIFDIGLRIIDQDGRKIKIYDTERTVCDIVKHRSKYDLELIKDIISNYLSRDDCDVDKLLAYANDLRIYSVVKQYVEILGGKCE